MNAPTLEVWNRLNLSEIPRLPRLNDYVRVFAGQSQSQLAAADRDGFGLPVDRLTYRELQSRIEGVQELLIVHGVAAGDRVAVLSPPHSRAWVSFLATVRSGAVWLGLNPRYGATELEYILTDAAPKLILAWRGSAQAQLDALKSSAPDATLLWLDDVPSAAHQTPSKDFSEPDKPCLLVYTSGTTGDPKGALLRQSGLVECSRVQAHHYGQASGRVLNPLPMNHVGSICDTGTTTLVTGGAQVFMADFDPADYIAAIEEEGITSLGGVPTMLQFLMAQPQFSKADLSSVARILWSGSPMPRPAGQALAALGLPMHNFYGMTETTGSLTFTDPDAGLDELLETVGRPHADYDVRIADAATDLPLEPGEVGEIQARSPGVLHSYLGRPEATKAAITKDGFYKTGDLGQFDANGRLCLRGRAKEMFKSGGYNVYPAEIEAALEELDEVEEAVVAAKSDPIFFEVGHAFLRIAPNSKLDPKDIKDRLGGRLANYKIPKSFEVVEEFPILPIGKVDRQALRRRANSDTL